MKILDFLFYCNYKWTIKYSQTETTKAYAGSFASISLAIWFMIFATSIYRVVEFCLHRIQLKATQLLIIDAVALLVFFLLKYIYVTKERLKIILEKDTPIYNVSDKAAIKLVGVVGIILIVLFIGVPIILNVISK